MVRVTSVPDLVLAGTLKVIVPLALPPSLGPILTFPGEVKSNLRSLLTCTVNVPVTSEDTVKGMMMRVPGSMLILSACAWKSSDRRGQEI